MDHTNLSINQTRFLELVQDTRFSSLPELCQKADISLRTYRTWCAEPEFRAALTADWSQAILSDGWLLLRTARDQANQNSIYFKALFNLIFDPKGQAALASWAHAASLGAPIAPAPVAPTGATPSPRRVANFLNTTIAKIATVSTPQSNLAAAPVGMGPRHPHPDPAQAGGTAQPCQAPRQAMEATNIAPTQLPAQNCTIEKVETKVEISPLPQRTPSPVSSIPSSPTPKLDCNGKRYLDFDFRPRSS